MSTNPHSVGDQIRSGLKGIHGAGEAIRGTVMDEIDKAVDPKSGSETGPNKNQAIANKGVADMKAADDNLGRHHGVQAGCANSVPKSTPNTTPGEGSQAYSSSQTGAGAHALAPGDIGRAKTTVGQGNQGVQEQVGVDQRF